MNNIRIKKGKAKTFKPNMAFINKAKKDYFEKGGSITKFEIGPDTPVGNGNVVKDTDSFLMGR